MHKNEKCLCERSATSELLADCTMGHACGGVGGGGDLGLAWEWNKVGGVDGDGGRLAEIGRSARTILHTHVQFNHPRRSHGTTRVTQEKP